MEDSGRRTTTVAETHAKPSAKRYTAGNLRWLERLVKWEKSYSRASVRADDVYWDYLDGKKKLAGFRRALRPMRNCARNFRAAVGEPSSERLHRGFELLLAACEQERRYAVARIQAYLPAGKRRKGTDEAAKMSERLFSRAQRSLAAGLLANRRLPVAGGLTRRSRIEPHFSRVAGRVAGRRVEVRCWSSRDWKATVGEYELFTDQKADIAGFANPPARANLMPRACANLARFTYGHWRPAGDDGLVRVADAVELLAHETEHLVNRSGSEAETECRGLQAVRRFAQVLGASPSYSGRLARVYWERSYPAMPRSYRTNDCRNGGSLDMDPGSGLWP